MKSSVISCIVAHCVLYCTPCYPDINPSMFVGLTEAAALIGKAPSTITRAVKAGRLSSTQDPQGRTVYDVAELERVYGPLKAPDVARNDAPAMQSNAAQLDTQRAHEVEKATLERLISHLEAANKDLTTERDRLLGIIEEQATQMRLLTDQRPKEPAPAEPEPPKGFLRWLFGK